MRSIGQFLTSCGLPLVVGVALLPVDAHGPRSGLASSRSRIATVASFRSRSCPLRDPRRRAMSRDVMKIVSAGVFTWFGLSFLLGLALFAGGRAASLRAAGRRCKAMPPADPGASPALAREALRRRQGSPRSRSAPCPCAPLADVAGPRGRGTSPAPAAGAVGADRGAAQRRATSAPPSGEGSRACRRKSQRAKARRHCHHRATSSTAASRRSGSTSSPRQAEGAARRLLRHR